MQLSPNWRRWFQGPPSRAWIIFAIIWACLWRVEHRYHYRNFFFDTQLQLSAMQQWMEGQGWNNPVFQENDLARPGAATAERFMPAYAGVVALAYLLTGDWLTASFGTDAVLLILILWGWAQLLAWLLGGWRSWWIVFFLLWQAFSPAPLHYMAGGGLLSLAAFLWAVYALLLHLNRPQAGFVLGPVYLGLLALAAWSRYAYFPFLFLPLGAWGGKSLWQKKAIPWKLLSSLLFLTLIGVMSLAWGKDWSESYLTAQTRQWFWEHWLHWDPFPFKAFFYFGIPHELGLFYIHESLYYGLSLLAYLVSGLILLLLMWQGWNIWKQAEAPTAWGLYLGTLALVLAANLVMLAYLSLVWPPQDWNWTGFWTFVMETRYYMPSMTLIILAVIYSGQKLPQGYLRRACQLLLLLSLCAAYSYPLWLKVKVYAKGETAGTFVSQAHQLIHDSVKALSERTDHVIWVSMEPLQHTGELAGGNSLPARHILTLDQIPASLPVEILWVEPLGTPAHSAPLQKLVDKGAVLWQENAYFQVFRLTFGPNEP
ncbi:MAG: hypothetical protein AAFR61_25050 [Bacteroidota bacterium]